MARRRSTKKKQDTLVDVVEVKDNAQDFMEKNQNTIFGALVALVLIVGGIFAYNNFYKAPRQKEAVEQMYQAQVQFERDSFALALENPGGGYGGFLDIIDNYSGTDAANLAQYYAGICYLNLGNFEVAASYLEDFSPAGKVLPAMKYGALGDAYSELKDLAKAEGLYAKAASSSDNEFTSAYYLQKLGLLYEKQQNFSASLDAFQQIKDKYPLSSIGRDVEKYIARVSAKK